MLQLARLIGDSGCPSVEEVADPLAARRAKRSSDAPSYDFAEPVKRKTGDDRSRRPHFSISSYDWILDRLRDRVAAHGPMAPPKPASGPIPHYLTTTLILEAAEHLRVDWSRQRVFEHTGAAPVFAELHRRLGCKRYDCLAGPHANLGVPAARFPGFHFHAGPLSHFSRFRAGQFDWVEHVSPIADRSLNLMVLEWLANLTAPAGHLLFACQSIGSRPAAVLARFDLQMCIRHRLADGLEFLVAGRTVGPRESDET